MILIDLVRGNETDIRYRKMEAENGNRQRLFLQSAVKAALTTDRPFLSQTILKALNFHSIACLHPNAGVYRPCPIWVGDNGNFPHHWQLPDLMDDFTNRVNRTWENTDLFSLASYALWRLNAIHPFINGNGRTARATCLFILCVKSGQWMPLIADLPEAIRNNRDEYISILTQMDDEWKNGSDPDVKTMVAFLSRLCLELLKQNLKSTPPPPPPPLPSS